ncbi:molybdate ABC transporter substrate-binding protein [Pseudoxanthomonas koreensis]|uniref:molybdate ABC transporter substrate-binding protein n=1 Tax=Pseudoxanthomonas koreensis TaxID=266061 RepID=UPI0013916B91|nr:molybdate ABC transporter substrate-binding protein [Pseudoxanthomonas koreensis]KAF1691752.1 molybdate ABC transporter substrate-binding protein [Pseudoxanthomonas koreensis]
MTRHLLKALLALSLWLPACVSAAAREAAPITVYAAASLKESLDESVAAWRKAGGQPVVVSYAGSSALARQIEQGAPADVFFAADTDWMDYLQQRGLVDASTRRNLLHNTLVLVAPAGSTIAPVALKPGVDIPALLGGGRIALGMTSSVPAGKYARAAFTSLGVWDQVAPRVAESENVRAAVMFVARGETPLGVVYGTDAKAEPRVRVVGTFPAGSHPEIVYPVARLKDSTHPGAKAFVEWLAGPQASAIFKARGFTTAD